MLWKLLAEILRRWSQEAWRRRADVADDDLRDARAQIAMRDSQISLLKAEVETLAAWRARELSRLEAEATIFRGRKVLGTDMPGTPES